MHVCVSTSVTKVQICIALRRPTTSKAIIVLVAREERCLNVMLQTR